MYSISTRTCAVTIFKSLLTAINQNMPNKEEKEKLLNPVLPVFINKLIGALGTPTGQHTNFAMKTEIIKGIRIQMFAFVYFPLTMKYVRFVSFLQF